MNSLSASTVVIIGGSSGIGLETARQAHSAGATLILTGRDQGRLDAARDEFGASAAVLDLGDPAGLHRFFTELPAPVDHVLVTGGGPIYTPIAEMDFDQARRVLDEHLLGSLRVARECVTRVRPGGSLTFLTGTHARRPGAGPGPRRRRGGRTTRHHGERRPGTRPDPGQCDRRRVRRHPAVSPPARRRARASPGTAPRDAADPASRRTGRRGGARPAPDDQHGTHRRDLRHRRWPAAHTLSGSIAHRRAVVARQDLLQLPPVARRSRRLCSANASMPIAISISYALRRSARTTVRICRRRRHPRTTGGRARLRDATVFCPIARPRRGRGRRRPVRRRPGPGCGLRCPGEIGAGRLRRLDQSFEGFAREVGFAGAAGSRVARDTH